MADVVGLVLPFFGMILIGFVVAKLMKHPVEGLAWMNVFILYIALPALFYQLLSKTPIEQLTQISFILASMLATFLIFATMFAGSLLFGGNVPESTIKALAAAYGNIGFMGPGLALIAFGEEAAVPVALIFCFENVMHFVLAPTLMALSGERSPGASSLALDIGRKILLHPFIVATILGVLAAAFHFRAPGALDRLLEIVSRAAAPCALFAMGVTLALRPLRRMPTAIGPIVLLKLFLHPLLCYTMLSLIGDFPTVWVWTAMLLASLPTATNVYIIAAQYGVWVERASASILVTTTGSVATVTALLYLIRSGVLPPDLFP
ncbi:AEC family transporter [Tianweitania sp.]|uniref:AEC family transporter n=1 Tax=Tianweitania sp. TaxID=2021634 RepID=UPI00289E941C|nr:AEC family transporter [Tianweitania sp.]